MSRSRRRRDLLAAAALAVVTTLAVATANAASTSRGNACSLLSASQVRSLHVSTSCVHGSKQVNRSGIHAGTINWGRWGNLHRGVVLANVYVINPAYVNIVKQKFLNDGTSAGIGTWSRWQGFANGKDEARIVFGVGNTIVDLALDPGSKHPLKSKHQVITLARSMLGRL
jgi:hypothetical protein